MVQKLVNVVLVTIQVAHDMFSLANSDTISEIDYNITYTQGSKKISKTKNLVPGNRG